MAAKEGRLRKMPKEAGPAGSAGGSDPAPGAGWRRQTSGHGKSSEADENPDFPTSGGAQMGLAFPSASGISPASRQGGLTQVGEWCGFGVFFFKITRQKIG
jgi:hypothetical protein